MLFGIFESAKWISVETYAVFDYTAKYQCYTLHCKLQMNNLSYLENQLLMK